MAAHSSILALENPMDRGAWWARVPSVAQSWTQVQRLSTRVAASAASAQGLVPGEGCHLTLSSGFRAPWWNLAHDFP